MLREPLRNGHSARITTEPDGIRTLSLTAVTLNDFSEKYTKVTCADPERVDDLWLKPGDILIQRSNTPDLVGTSALYKGRENWAIYPDLLIRLRLNSCITPEFAALMLSSKTVRDYFKAHAKGLAGSMPKIDQSTIASVKMPVPPLAEQHRIVETLENHLSRLDAASLSLVHAQALIPLQRRSLHTTATEGRLRTGTGDVVPDFLKQRRRFWESVQVKKYKEPTAPNLDQIPQFPTNWAVYSLEALTDPIRLIRYGILMPKVKHGGTVPYVEVKDLKGCSLHEKKLHLTSKDLDEQFAGARIQPGDVLLAVRGSYDRSAVVPSGLKGANLSRDVARIAPLPGIDPEYLQLYLQSSFTQRYLKEHARGVAVKGVNIGSIRALPVSVPPLATQKQIVEEVQQQITAIEAAARAVERSHARRAALRGALLNRAFTGQLVPQDASDEPASFVLDRIRAEREAQGGKAKRGTRRPRKAAEAAPPPAPASTPAPTNAVQQELPL
ncbi:type I restriction enzyme S subunit [Streptomyces sp. CG 926]|nr:type I restriction enzyme S subunit [Streptomyces sp. CG 926]